MKHEEALALVTRTAQLFEEKQSNEAEIIAVLLEYGIAHADARKLYLYVQSAFSWAVLKSMGVEKFGADFQIRATDGTTFHIPVAGQQLFTTALALGISLLQQGYTEEIPVSTFEAVVAKSDEVNAANKALSDGADITDSEILSTFYGFDAEDFGRRSKSWWQFWR